MTPDGAVLDIYISEDVSSRPDFLRTLVDGNKQGSAGSRNNLVKHETRTLDEHADSRGTCFGSEPNQQL